MDPRTFLVVLYVLAALLPLVGFGRLLLRAQHTLGRTRTLVAERGSVVGTLGDHDKMWQDITVAPRENRDAVVWDIVFVGLGLAAGAVASIWSLFL